MEGDDGRFIPRDKYVSTREVIGDQESGVWAQRIGLLREGTEVGKIMLYVLSPGIDEKPFGMINDLFVSEEYHSSDYDVRLIRLAILDAQRAKCSKVIYNSQHGCDQVHDILTDHDFKERGLEFILNPR